MSKCLEKNIDISIIVLKNPQLLLIYFAITKIRKKVKNNISRTRNSKTKKIGQHFGISSITVSSTFHSYRFFQIVSKNQSAYVSNLGSVTGFGPTTVVIHQSAEPFEFYSIYALQGIARDGSGWAFDEGVSTTTISTTLSTTDIISTTTSSPSELFFQK